jgi:aldose 1-epimerase
MRTLDLTNCNGMRVRVLEHGCSIVGIEVPDRHGRLADVALGFSDASEYRRRHPYFGCVVGRFGNRIAGGRFALDGQTYQLATNNAPGGMPCHLHGGEVGFDQRFWGVERRSSAGAGELCLHRVSLDGEEGYPGNLVVSVVYRLTDENALEIEYEAQTDAATPVNLTNHSYFNLCGEGSGENVLGHELTLHASRFLPTDAGQIPTGELRPVAGTPFDFRQPRPLGERLHEADAQLLNASGYDHNWVLDAGGGALALAAEVYEPVSGRVMEVLTTEPGVQLYAGNLLDGSCLGKSGRAYVRHGGLCLETQHFPDSPNRPEFPDTILRPGEKYRSKTVYRFGVR